MKRHKENNIDYDQLVSEINNLSNQPTIIDLKIDEFQILFQRIQKDCPGIPVDLIINGDWAIAQFSSVSSQRIRIIKPRRKTIFCLNPRRILQEKDFEFLKPFGNIFGTKRKFGFLQFVFEEIQSNWLILIISFLISYFFINTLINSSDGVSDIKFLFETLITILALFLSVFILFTVSQNAELIKDIYLFREGITFRFFRVDKYLAVLAFVDLLICLISFMIITLPSSITVNKVNITLHKDIIISLTGSFSITIIIDCFLGLISYYFKRVRFIFEKDLSKRFLDEKRKEQMNVPSDMEDIITNERD